MKKFIVLLMVALVAIALVACGGETATTTKAATTNGKPATTTAAPTTNGSVAITTGTTENKNPVTSADTTVPTSNTVSDPTNTTAPNVGGAFPEGIDILYGEYEYAAIDATWKGIYPCAFENHQPDFDYKWCLVFKMLPTEGYVQEDLIAMDEESGYGIAFEDYVWTVIINGEEFTITHFSIPQKTGFIYVRMGLGDWAPELGEHEYDIKLKITEASTGTIVYWAWMTDPDWGGAYVFDGPEPLKVIPTEKPEDVEALPTGSMTGISGPESLAATETYAKLFDGFVQTKLCSSDYDNPLIFTVNGTYSLRGISLVGANDDEKFNERVPVKFKLYGSDNGADDSWNLVLDVNKSITDITVTNYSEHYYGFAEEVSYTYFKLVIEDASGAETPKYQYSEILLYTTKDQ